MPHAMVMAKVTTDSTGLVQTVPILMSEEGPLESLLDYVLERAPTRSQSWMTKLVQAVSLLLSYVEAHPNLCSDPLKLMRAFAHCLSTGTPLVDGVDPTGLYWTSRGPANVNQMIGLLTQFSDWTAERRDTKPLNPLRPASRMEKALGWAAWTHQKNRALLGHTWGRTEAASRIARARTISPLLSPAICGEETKAFPDEKFSDLLFHGFARPGARRNEGAPRLPNLRDVLIAMLLNCGGIRISEAFHIYCQDVSPDPLAPDSAWVRVFHPAIGRAPNDYESIDNEGRPWDRHVYLMRKYGMQPRTFYKSTDQLHAGWKGSLLDHKDNYFNVHWFPTSAGRLFWRLWLAYMAYRATLNCEHPFAFVTREGRPYAVKDYMEAHARAVRRIGLHASKASGTTPHGHRHAYGQRLTRMDVSPIFRRKALHHRSLESQVVYTEPNRVRLKQALEDAHQRSTNTNSDEPINFLMYGFEDVDPLGLLSGPHPKLDHGREHA